MRVNIPLEVTDAILTACSVPEPDVGEVAWDPEADYDVGDRAYLPSTHTIYQRSIAGTTSTSPDIDPTNWLVVGPTNRWAALDRNRDTPTVYASPVVYTFEPGRRINAVNVMAMVADQVTIIVIQDDVERYRYTEALSTRNTQTWSQYFFGAFTSKADIVRLDLPPYVDATIQVILERSTGDVSVGSIVPGNHVYLGDVETGAQAGSVSASVVTDDGFSGTVIKPQRAIPDTTQTILIDKQNINTVLAAKTQTNGQVVPWMGIDDSDNPYFSTFLVQGVWTQFDITGEDSEFAKATLGIRGF